MKFYKNTILAFILIVGVGVGVFILDFVTDIQFSLDILKMSRNNFSDEIGECRYQVVFQLDTTRNCFHSNSTQREIFRCMEFLNKLQKEASKCFNRGQHFQNQSRAEKEFQYMRDNLNSFRNPLNQLDFLYHFFY